MYDNLDAYSVSIINDAGIRRAYLNSEADRGLLKDAVAPGEYEAIMAVWGDVPMVEPPEIRAEKRTPARIEAVILSALTAAGALTSKQENDALDRINVPVDTSVEPEPFAAGQRVGVGAVRTYGGVEYECVQAHTTQGDWTPDAAAALWRVKTSGGNPWKQPTGAHDAYGIGDIVSLDGRLWKSLIHGNTTRPGGDPRWWEDVGAAG